MNHPDRQFASMKRGMCFPCSLPLGGGVDVLMRLRRGPLIICMLSFLLAGCSVPGAIAYKVLGPDSIKPEFTPPPTEPVLIFAEDYDNQSMAIYESEELIRVVEHDFKEHKVAPVIDPDKLFNLLGTRQAGRNAVSKPAPAPQPRSITDIGRQLGAARVLYINIVDNEIESLGGSEMMRGKLAVRVRMIDVASGKTVYPANSIDGTYLSASTPYTEVHGGVTRQTLRQKLCTGVGQQIARLFYPYKPDEVAPDDSP